MRHERSRAATAATAPCRLPQSMYRQSSRDASGLNEILGQLLIGLETERLRSGDRVAVLEFIDGLIRENIDRGLLKGGCR